MGKAIEKKDGDKSEWKEDTYKLKTDKREQKRKRKKDKGLRQKYWGSWDISEKTKKKGHNKR